MNQSAKKRIAELLLKCGFSDGSEPDISNNKIFDKLEEIDTFYRPIGGLKGYVKKIYDTAHSKESGQAVITPPPYFDFLNTSADYITACTKGLQVCSQVAEIYVVGGAGDRLGLQCPITGQALPAARLPFCGRSLLTGLFRDLEAREYLSSKITGWRGYTPVILMTSSEKRNDEEIAAILKEENYFDRPRDSFFIVKQPQAPVITLDGRFVLHEGELLLKPGGHGVLWKLLKDHSAFTWLKQKGARYALVRQINNPIAAIDGALIALLGLGVQEHKAFGFAGCVPVPMLAEGVLVRKSTTLGHTITNHEYTKDPLGGQVGLYPANTNLLFADLVELEKICDTMPFPGMMINKNALKVHTPQGEIAAVRLETTMQNIADAILSPGGSREVLQTFLLLLPRERLISVTKKLLGALETPQRAFYDYLQVCRALFGQLKSQSYEEYEREGPQYLFFYHPVLGAMQKILQAKLVDVQLLPHAELEIEIAELYMKNVVVQGSLQIIASLGSLRSSNSTEPVAYLENVKIINQGTGVVSTEQAWKREYTRSEVVRVVFEGSGALIMKNITLEGTHTYTIPDGYALEVTAAREKLTRLSSTPKLWEYLKDGACHLHKLNLG